MEYTRLDQMIDVVFTTARDVESATQAELPEEDDEVQDSNRPEPQAESSISVEKPKGVWEFTDSGLLDEKRQDIVACFGRRQGAAFVKKSRALFWDPGHQKRLACTISKRYLRGSYPYWYAYHPEWDEFLSEGNESFLILGCMDLPFAFSLPWAVLHSSLNGLNTTTTKDNRTYWHIHLAEVAGHYTVNLPKRASTLPLDEYRIILE